MRAPARLLTAAAVAAALLPAAANANEPVDDALALSSDGVTWSDSLTTPLFDPALRWVPGDVRTARFFVRNQQPDAGDLTVVLERAVRRDLIDTGWLAVSARAGNQPFTTVTDGGRHELLNRGRLRPDTPLEVVVRVAMDAAAPNPTMVLSTDLDFTLTLTDSDAVLDAGEGAGAGADGGGGAVIDLGGNGGPSTGAGSGPDGGVVADNGGSIDGIDPVEAGNSADFLPGTGSEFPSWLPPLGVLLLGSGAYLVLRRRDREDEPAAVLH